MTALTALDNIRHIREPLADYSTESRHFTRIEDDIVDAIAAMGAHLLGIYAYLERRANRQGQVKCSYGRIAEDLNISRRHAITSIKKLEAANYITITTPPNTAQTHTANTFTLPYHKTGEQAGEQAGEYSAPPSEQAGEQASAPPAPKVDTSSYQVDTPSGANEKQNAKPDGEAVALLQAYAQVTGLHTFVGAQREKNLEYCRSLAAMGATPADIPPLYAHCQTQTWANTRGLGLMVHQYQDWKPRHAAEQAKAKAMENRPLIRAG